MTTSHDKPLLPNEPRIVDRARQQQLTEQHLLPVLPELGVFFLAIRHALDPLLMQQQPAKLGKPYPLGQCLEISLAVWQHLNDVHCAEPTGPVANGLTAFKAFRQAGGMVRQVWGALREQYFQNAFQVGTLYVDVANDTVVATKPKVEILPFDHAQLVAVRDYAHFQLIGARYWQERSYPNHVLPELAPYCPLIHVTPDGRTMVREATHYMVSLTRSQGFHPSEAVLQEAPMPAELFARVRQALAGSTYHLAPDPEQGRRQALQHCQRYRQHTHHPVNDAHQAILSTQDINMRLASVNTLQLDGQHYNLNSLSAQASSQLANLQFVDQEIARLQALLAAMHAARETYLRALRAELPPLQPPHPTPQPG